MAILEITIKTKKDALDYSGGVELASLELVIPDGTNLASYPAAVLSLATKALVAPVDKAPGPIVLVETDAEE